MLTLKKGKTKKELRRFGLVMTAPLLILGLLLIWKDRMLGPYLIGLAAFFLLSGLLFPRILAPIERLWMAFARVLSVLMTQVLLTLTFFLIITPMGLLLRLLGRDLLQKKFKENRASFWAPVEPDGPCSRPDKPY